MTFYLLHNGQVLFEEAATPQAALAQALAGEPDDGLWEIWPTVIEKINNENY
jgi:hypothetical protein